MLKRKRISTDSNGVAENTGVKVKLRKLVEGGYATSNSPPSDDDVSDENDDDHPDMNGESEIGINDSGEDVSYSGCLR